MPPKHSFPPSHSFDTDSTLGGALLVGVLFSYVLFGVTTTQTYLYSTRFPNDSAKTKWLVACVWLCELGHVICIGHTLYVLVITDIAHPDRLITGSFPQSLGASTLFNAVLSTCVQGFFSFRIYRLWKRLYIPLLAWTLSFLFLGASAVVFIVGQQSIPFPLFEAQWGWLLDALWSVAAANDLLIALTLVFWLVGQRDESQRSTALVDKLIAWTIGALSLLLSAPAPRPYSIRTSVAAILNLVCFVTMKNNFIWIAWYVVTARLYSNPSCKASSLNSRTTLRTMNQLAISKPSYPLYSSNPSINTESFLAEMRTPTISAFSRHPSVSANSFAMK
ncbi:hypothetical protein B0H13DRAFT_2671493 [Mycena leptocephala]|nr:hypothetical protein B0H13DRAFT_2671493 [Mycena leptocephala]